MKANDNGELPPIVKQIHVRCAPARAFQLFTEEIGQWWPLATHSLAEHGSTGCWIEPRVGGRVFERDANGREIPWGQVLVWEPPARLRFTWRVGDAAKSQQEVEVRFEAVPQGTRVVLTHSGWERAEHRTGYDQGWDGVLACYIAKSQ